MKQLFFLSPFLDNPRNCYKNGGNYEKKSENLPQVVRVMDTYCRLGFGCLSFSYMNPLEQPAGQGN